jgi:GTP-binding protein
MQKKVLALVGRPNVGKSTLFNRLAGQKKAITHPIAGVTRDRKYTNIKIDSFEFTIIDTPGLEECVEGVLEQRMMRQTKEAILEADLVCFIVDGRDGVLPTDKFFANFVRNYTKNHILIVNKCEKAFNFSGDYYKLGMGDPIPVSAEHAIGMSDLYDTIINRTITAHDIGLPYTCEGIGDSTATNFEGELANLKISGDKKFFNSSLHLERNDSSIQIVVTGRPNVGKSTFINSLLNEERVLTGSEAGITRESIEINWEYKGHKMKLIDTAGLRRQSTINSHLEKLSASDAINSIDFANTVILMLDAQNPLEQQDLNIANYVIDQGRSLIIVVNKWDLIQDKTRFKEGFQYKLDTNLPQIKGVPIIYISAINKQNINNVLDESINIYAVWNKRISTNKLNNWLRYVVHEHPLPLQQNGRIVKIKYITQIKTRPPTFKLFSNNPDKVIDSYRKYLINKLRENFDLYGVPIRFIFDKSNNPYV